jgi:hypothetical protein
MSINYTSDNTFIFAFVRMNPPTPGHLFLIKTMIDKAIDLGINKIYVITSSSLDGKNPLPCSKKAIPKAKNKADATIINNLTSGNFSFKSQILNQMIYSYKNQLINDETDVSKKNSIQNVNVIVLCSTGSPFVFINSVIENEFIEKGESKINMFFIVGRDRADFLDTVVDTFKTKDYTNSINGLILEREGMDTLKNEGLGKRSISEISQSEYSASFIRNLVKSDQKDDFIEVYDKYLSPDEINNLYDTIKLGTRMKSPLSKDEDENPRSKYFDTGLLPIIVSSTGGRKRRKTKKHKRIKRRKTRRYK